MAAVYLPAATKTNSNRKKRGSDFRWVAPGIPPGSTTMSYSSCRALSSVRSGTSCTPRLALTTPGLSPALTTSMPARRNRSMMVTASSSSQPSASGTKTLAIFVSWCSVSKFVTEWSIAEILILQRKVGDALPHQRDGLLQHVTLGTRHTHGVALNTGLHLQLAVLDAFDDLLRQFGLAAGFHGHAALDLVARDLLDATDVKAFHVDATLGELLRQNVLRRGEGGRGGGGDRQHVVGLLDTGIGALEIETGGRGRGD